MAQKKTFKETLNPALQFISSRPTEQVTSADPTEATQEKKPTGYKINPLYIETKSKRLQLLIQPSLYEKVKARATAENQSINNTIHSILDEALKGE